MMMDTDDGRVPTAPGSRPTDQAPSGLGASRFDPSRVSGFYRDERGDFWFCCETTYRDGQSTIVCHGKTGRAAEYMTAANRETFAIWNWTRCDSDTHPKGGDASGSGPAE